MPELALYSRGFDEADNPRGFVARVVIPEMHPQPEVIHHGMRFFVLNVGGHYVEGLVWQADELALSQDP